MSYRSDMEKYTEEMSRWKKTVMLTVKIVAILLAVSLVATGALVIVDIASDNFSHSSGKNDGGGASASYISATQGKKVTVKQGSTVAYLSLVTVDEKYASCTIEVDSSKVDLNKPGSYVVTYKLIDENQKTISTYKITIVVEEVDENMEELMSLVKTKAENIGLTEDSVKDMTTEQIVRKIYDYVKDPSANKNDANIYFSDESNIPNIDRDNWESDWVKEATLALKSTRMKGDCYTYYSVSKAFFEYFEIENVGIRRGSDAESDGTHFWQVVNVGTKKEPKWYYYDATRLAGKFSDGSNNSCLITLEKLESYVSTDGKEGFYHFDPSKYPTAETTPLG